MIGHPRTTKGFERWRIHSPSMCTPGSFRTQIMGRHLERVSCKDRQGNWITQAMLIRKGAPDILEHRHQIKEMLERR